MFDFFRNNIRFLMGFLMLLIIPSFVLFGIEGYSRFRQGSETVAQVGKSDISRDEWDRVHRSETDNLMARNPGLDRARLESEEARLATLEQMVVDRLLLKVVNDAHLVSTNQRLSRALLQDPNIASLRRADGTLDMEQYHKVLKARGLSAEQYESGVRADLARQQVVQGVAVSSFLPQALGSSALQAVLERREVQLLPFRPRDYAGKVQVDAADIQKYYDDNPQQFKTVESVDLEYVVLDLASVARQIKPSESDVRAYYEQNVASKTKQEQRRASHILLTVEPGATADARAKVKAQAEALLAEVKKAPGRFAEMAKNRSQDPGSSDRGGDLDYMVRGAMVKPFEDAVFALEKGQISPLVETEYGYHIIQLTDIRVPAVEPFEAVRAKLEDEIRLQQAQRKYAEAAEDFSNFVYEQADSFANVAQKLGLTVKTARQLTRDGQSATDPLLKQDRLLAVVFESDSVQHKRNTKAVEVGANTLVSARVVEHRPVVQKPFAEVQAAVKERLVHERALAMAKAEAQAKLKALREGAEPTGLGAPLVLARDVAPQVPNAVMQVAMSTPLNGDKAAWALADVGAEGAVLVRVNRTLKRELPAGQERELQAQVAQLWQRAEARAYLEALKAQYRAKVLAKKSTEKS